MSAHEEIRALLQRYARAADERNIEALADLYHPEAEISGARGTLSRNEWLATMRGPRPFPKSMHMLGDPLIDLDLGTNEARIDTYAVVFQLSEPDSGQADLTLGMRYVDDAVVHEGRWVIRRRTTETIWMR